MAPCSKRLRVHSRVPRRRKPADRSLSPLRPSSRSGLSHRNGLEREGGARPRAKARRTAYFGKTGRLHRHARAERLWRMSEHPDVVTGSVNAEDEHRSRSWSPALTYALISAARATKRP